VAEPRNDPQHPTRAQATNGRRRRFLAALGRTATVTEACDAAGIERSTAYRWRESSPAVVKAWDAAVARVVDRLEAEAVRRAADGWEEPVYQQGREVGRVLKFSDRMLELLLKRHKPEFRDKAAVELSGPNGGAVPLTVTVPDERSLEAAALVLDRLRARGVGLAGAASAMGAPHTNGHANGAARKA
jgi:hypothetical protein